MSTKSKTTEMLVMLAMLFVTLLGVVYLFIIKSPVVVNTPTPTPKLSPKPTAQPSLTPTLESINKLSTPNYSFSYAPNLTVVKDNSSYSIRLPSSNYIYIFETTDDSATITSYLLNLDKSNSTAYEGQPSVMVQSTRKTIFNQLPSIQREERLLAAGLDQTATYFKKQKIIITIVLRQYSPSTADDILFYNQIINSLSFNTL